MSSTVDQENSTKEDANKGILSQLKSVNIFEEEFIQTFVCFLVFVNYLLTRLVIANEEKRESSA